MTPIRKVPSYFCIIFLLISLSSAFLPNHIGSPPFLNDDDYTLTDITEIGILLSVAKYFEKTPLDGRPPVSPGDFVNLDPLTPSTLYDAYYGGGVSSAKFESAIEQIVSANVEVSRLQAGIAEWHFNAEQIIQANKRMVRLRNNIISILNSTSPNYDTARTYTGQFLHMYHSFYSNTDWVELVVWLNYIALMPDAPLFPYTDLGIAGKPYFPVAPPSQHACRNCVFSPGRPEGDCAYNIWDARMGVYLTSGYRSEQDFTKPESNDAFDYFGKCSHGGPNDDSKERTAAGGMNKEGTDPILSPHYYHHVEAAELAILCTELFLSSPDYGLLNVSGEEAYRKLLNLGTGATLAFVIDETGSMRDEILAVKNEAIEIIRETNGTYDAPYNYVVVPFGDPVVGPVLVTEDPQECIDFIAALDPYGGGDCPELCNSGLELALLNSLPGSQIYVFTDASDKDSRKAAEVAALAQTRQCRVDYIITGDCNFVAGDENDNANSQQQHQERHRRSSTRSEISDSYTAISEKSGGAVYETEKENIGEVTEIIQIGLGSSKVALLKWSGSGSGANETALEFLVDGTVSEFSLSMTGAVAAPNITLIDPSGEPVSYNGTNVKLVVNVELILAITATEPDTGPWTIRFNDDQSYKIDVIAQSTVDFSYQFLETDALGVTYPAVGSPIAGAASMVSVNVVGMEQVGNADFITLMATNGTELQSYSLELAGGRATDVFITEIVPPTEPFTIRFDGRDVDGNLFSRLLSTQIQAQSFKLDFIAASSDELLPGSTKVVQFSLRNEGINDTFTISASSDDPATVTVSVIPSEVLLLSGESVQGNLTFTARVLTVAGTISTATLFAASSSGATTSLVTSQAVVEPDTEILDIIRPECAIISSIGTCTSDMMKAEVCADHRWQIVFEAVEEGSGIYAMDVFPLANSTEYQLDTSTPYYVNGSYESDCCCPLATINIQDYYGNLGQCSLDYYAPLANTTNPPPCLPQPPILPTTRATTVKVTTRMPPLTTLRMTPKPVDDGLSAAAIAGISVGSALIVVIIVVTVAYVMCKKKEAKITSYAQDSGPNDYGTHDNPTFTDEHLYGNIDTVKTN